MEQGYQRTYHKCYLGEEDIMAIEKVRAHCAQFGIADRVREFEVSSATVELAAQALNCEPCRIAKTLSFMVDGHAVLIVAAGDAKIDNPKYKAQFGAKAKMLTPDEAETLIGHAVGGVCPFAVNEGVTVYLDCSLRACLISSDEDGNEGESKNLSRNNEFTLTIFPKPAEFVQPAEKALYHPTTRQHNKSV